MYKYSLNKTSKKHFCPKCSKKTFVQYVNNESGEVVSNISGRCDRENNCGYHYTPKLFFKDNNQEYNPIMKNPMELVAKKETSYHSQSTLDNTLCNYTQNNLVEFLKRKCNSEKLNLAIENYKVGTISEWHFGTVFWQIDNYQKIKGGKIIIYNKLGKRTKYINWIHALQLKNKEIDEFQLSQCLFGLHLLNKYDKTIAIVESEKTALIMSVLFDKYLWMATGSLNGLSIAKIKELKSRKIILYPDLGVEGANGSPFSQWNEKREEFKRCGFDIEVSDLLEKKGTQIEKEKGFDIADYFMLNKQSKTEKLISSKSQTMLNLYMRNNNLKTLIDVFDLRDENGMRINF